MSQQPPSSYDPDAEPKEDQPPTLCQRPPPYPLEEAIEAAHAPEPTFLPTETAEPWDAPQRRDQQASAQLPTEEQQGSEGATGQPGLPPATLPPATGQEPQLSGAQEPLQVLGAAKDATLFAGAGEPTQFTAPVTVAAALESLPQWQARYVLALLELGGNLWLACRRCNVSRASVTKAQGESPAFAAACVEAVESSTDLIEASTFRGATVGDLKPKYHQGFVVGYDRVRDTRAAELMLKVRGRLEDGATKGPASATLLQVTVQTDVSAVVTTTMAKLFAARAAQKQAR